MPRRFFAAFTGGTIASTSVVASVSTLWASLPPEVRGMLGATIAAFVAELVGLGRAWLRARGERLFSVRVDAAELGERATVAPAQPEPEPAQAEQSEKAGIER